MQKLQERFKWKHQNAKHIFNEVGTAKEIIHVCEEKCKEITHGGIQTMTRNQQMNEINTWK